MKEDKIQEWVIHTMVIVACSFMSTMMLIGLFTGNMDVDSAIFIPVLIVNFLQSQIINFYIYNNEKHK